MDALWALLVGIAESTLRLIQQMLSLINDLTKLPGFWALLIAVIIFVICIKVTENLGAALLVGAAGFFVVWFIAGVLIWPVIFGGGRLSVESCYKNAGSDAAAKRMCDTIANGNVPATAVVGAPSSNAAVVVVPQAPVQPTPIVKRIFKKDALSILTAGWNLNPPDWPSKIGGLIGANQVPTGLKVTFSSTNYQGILNNPIAETWTISILDPGGNMDNKILTANGYVVRESRGFNIQNSGVTLIGTGSWDQLCSVCYTDTIVMPPTPVVTQTPTLKPGATTIGSPVQFSVSQMKVACGYWGYQKMSDGTIRYIPTTNNGPDIKQLTSVEYALSKCPTIPRP